MASYENAHQYGQPFILETAWGNVGVMHDEEGLIPEWARVLMLEGADCVVWTNSLSLPSMTAVARCRAAENRVFVVTSQAGTETSTSLAQIIDPGGIILASTLRGQKSHACGTFACFANSRMKNIVPGTHVVYNRHPEAYKKLAEG